MDKESSPTEFEISKDSICFQKLFKITEQSVEQCASFESSSCSSFDEPTVANEFQVFEPRLQNVHYVPKSAFSGIGLMFSRTAAVDTEFQDEELSRKKTVRYRPAETNQAQPGSESQHSSAFLARKQMSYERSSEYQLSGVCAPEQTGYAVRQPKTNLRALLEDQFQDIMKSKPQLHS